MKKRINIEESQKIKHFIRLPDYFTLGNALCGLFSILCSIMGEFSLAVLFMFISAIFDGLDGLVARKINRQGNFGKEMDSLADVVSFGIAPIVFGLMNNKSVVAIIAFVLFLSAGLLRLARFNVTESDGNFYGMPITMSALIIPIIYFANLSVDYYFIVYLVMAFLMILPIKLKKI